MKFTDLLRKRPVSNRPADVEGTPDSSTRSVSDRLHARGSGSMKEAFERYEAEKEEQRVADERRQAEYQERAARLFERLERREAARSTARQLLGENPDPQQPLHRMVLMVSAMREVGRDPAAIADLVGIEEDFVASVLGRFSEARAHSGEASMPETPEDFAAMAEICEDESARRIAAA